MLENVTTEKELHEACGLFGLWKGGKEAAHVAYFALHALQHRGQEGAGIVTLDSKMQEVKQFRGYGLLSEVFHEPQRLQNLTGDCAIGHVSYTLNKQASGFADVQPLVFHFYDQTIAIAHNGNLTNAKVLRRELEAEGAVFQSGTDAEILVHLIRHSKKSTFHERLKESLCKLQGGFTFIVMTNDELIGIVDANSFRPLAIGQMPSGAYVLASETCALHSIGAKFVRNIHAGNFASITDKGLEIFEYTTKTQIALDAMEYIYFSRPDSEIAGINVHSARKKMGEILAKEAPAPHADMVIGVPNSSLSAATGYAEASGLPYEMGLIRNQYTARTFIEPTQELREQGVRKKLSPVVGVVQGRSVVLVDDSIVRGTTARHIVEMLKNAGAAEVHLRIASPPLRFPNFYGIDVSTSGELLAATHTVSEMCSEIGADSLEFMSVEGLLDAIGTHFDAPNRGLCLDVFTGEYPAPIVDYEATLKKELSPLQKRVLKGEDVDGK
ncbi:amidophosphoribosyltransferase [Allofustis seminis]|uniref:amidophosphoribosyltransferase n=1 Tax=Allofustis seminis TaxID=166939 RepID=UPI000364AACF|nr:amidophosphoribosyltransferase [Allofustis seminis]